MNLLLNGHAGAGLGELLVAASVLAFAATAAIFLAIYRGRPSRWLRILGLFYAGSIIAHLAVSFAIFPNLALVACWYALAGFPAACLLGIAHLIFRDPG